MAFGVLRLLKNDFGTQFKIYVMNISEIMLSNILFKILFQNKIKFKLDFKTRDIFQRWKAMILERLRRSFGLEIESNTDSNENRHFLIALLNLKQYINTKINAWRHECSKHLYRA
jgi:hypothetical protein